MVDKLYPQYLRLTLLLLHTTYPVLPNSVDPDQLASEDANWSGSALFVIKHVNLYKQPGSSNLIGRKLDVGVACGILIYSAWQWLNTDNRSDTEFPFLALNLTISK